MQAEFLQKGRSILQGKMLIIYFSRIMAHATNLNPESVRQVVPALQKFADFEEHGNAEEKFSVESRIVLQSLECHNARWCAVEAAKLTDPHDDLPTNVLTYNDHRRGFLHMLEQNDWHDMTFSWSTCRSTYLQNHNARKLTLS